MLHTVGVALPIIDTFQQASHLFWGEHKYCSCCGFSLSAFGHLYSNFIYSVWKEAKLWLYDVNSTSNKNMEMAFLINCLLHKSRKSKKLCYNFMHLLRTKRGHGEGWKCLDASKLRSEQQRHIITVVFPIITSDNNHCRSGFVLQEYRSIAVPWHRKSTFQYKREQMDISDLTEYYKKQLGPKC